MATEVRETENKYEFGPGAVLPCLGDLPGVAQESGLAEQKLEAEYYDTSDLRLVRAGVTLRRRRGGSDAGCTSNFRWKPARAAEIRLPLGRPSRPVPAELATLVRAYARGQALAPIALITTVRRPRAPGCGGRVAGGGGDRRRLGGDDGGVHTFEGGRK